MLHLQDFVYRNVLASITEYHDQKQQPIFPPPTFFFTIFSKAVKRIN